MTKTTPQPRRSRGRRPGSGRRAPRRQRPARSAEEVFRRTVGRARRPAAPAPRRRDGPALGLDPVAVPGVQRRGRSSRSALPATAPTARCPKLRLRAGEPSSTFGNLGYADTAIASYRVFARLKRDGVVPAHVPFPGLAADAAGADRRVRRPRAPGHRSSRSTRRAVLEELGRLLAVIPHDQLALQWDTRLEFAMLEGVAPAWFSEVRGGVLERLLRLARHVPATWSSASTSVTATRRTGTSSRRADMRQAGRRSRTRSPRALARTLDWVHMPVRARPTRPTSRRCASCRCSPRPSSTSA